MKSNQKQLGVLCHVSSIPNKYGIGDFGKQTLSFVKFLASQKINIWQTLPLNPTNKYNCPYGAHCSFTFDEMFVDVEDLVKQKLVKKSELTKLKSLKNTKLVNYNVVKAEKLRILSIAYNNISPQIKNQVLQFAQNKPKMVDYGYYKVLLKHFNVDDWHKTNKAYWNKQTPEYKEFFELNKTEIFKHVFFQFVLTTQWNKVKQYANSLGISILGDMPAYLEPPSLDVFLTPEVFKLDKNLNPLAFGGSPADVFSSIGQNWGTCVYDWKYLKTTNYNWAIDRIKTMQSYYDIVRIDHFPSVVEHFEIDASNNKTTRWVKAGGVDFFNTLKNQGLINNLVIEDVGILTKDCHDVIKQFNLTGMRILQYAFDSDNNNPYLPHNVENNCIYYLGTHDSNTFVGFLNENPNLKQNLQKYFNITDNNNCNILIHCVKQMLNSKANMIILQIQDFLMQDQSFRINYPGVAADCWEYRFNNKYKKQFAKTIKQLNWR